MAYINKETFNIRQDVPNSDINDYFEVDELIAPVISILNKKGYYTSFCCSGHPYITESEGIMGVSKDSNIEELLQKDSVYNLY